MTWTAEARATSRSEEVPPVRTVTRIAALYLVPISCCRTSYRLTMPDQLPVLPNQRRRALPGQHGAQPVGREEASTSGKGASITSRTGRSSSAGWASARVMSVPSINPPTRLAVVDHRDLAHAPGAHQVERLAHRGGRRHAHQRRGAGRPALEQLLRR